jgi:hypothetical protein
MSSRLDQARLIRPNADDDVVSDVVRWMFSDNFHLLSNHFKVNVQMLLKTFECIYVTVIESLYLRQLVCGMNLTRIHLGHCSAGH